ncbi:hypothetical protein SMICM304S_04439 [Streptomyces microflavus]
MPAALPRPRRNSSARTSLPARPAPRRRLAAWLATASPNPPQSSSTRTAICTTCSLAESRCADGRRLAHLAAHTQRTAPLRRQRQTEQEEQADQRAWALRLLRDQQWDRVAGRVHQADQQRVRDVLTALRKMLLAPAKAGDTPLTTWERADLETTIAVLERQRRTSPTAGSTAGPHDGPRPTLARVGRGLGCSYSSRLPNWRVNGDSPRD